MKRRGRAMGEGEDSKRQEERMVTGQSGFVAICLFFVVWAGAPRCRSEERQKMVEIVYDWMVRVITRDAGEEFAVASRRRDCPGR
ncbi:hypothetical protein AVEN_161429-1 [Araneus ventricosus]|uniref:Uncharacterized protein n=1 Tax=Araneus ventricosus TaxID=182803 RepID=A0A4Y2N042_ARAVE|nr:hypothetical protein AVEN_68221-1 [Araneus ventricosus]GBN31467.1 hypothetical protein AVEN_161429-1 [Araneus ventricosus]